MNVINWIQLDSMQNQRSFNNHIVGVHASPECSCLQKQNLVLMKTRNDIYSRRVGFMNILLFINKYR